MLCLSLQESFAEEDYEFNFAIFLISFVRLHHYPVDALVFDSFADPFDSIGKTQQCYFEVLLFHF
jgi:hypothetical protein